MKPANFAPVYCAIYLGLAEIARAHGYALAIHGSLARDADLICIPWIAVPAEPAEVIAAMCAEYAIQEVGQPGAKEHGRIAHTLSIAFGECAIDLSFMPRLGDPHQTEGSDQSDLRPPCEGHSTL